MTGSRPVSDLYEEFGPDERHEIERERDRLVAEYELLADLRKERRLTQSQVAELMAIGQSAVSKIESQDDLLVGTLRRYARALGGELEIRIRFPDGVVALDRGAEGDPSSDR